MRARGRDKASRKRIWWRGEVSPIPGRATHGKTRIHGQIRSWSGGLFILLQATVVFSPSLWPGYACKLSICFSLSLLPFCLSISIYSRLRRSLRRFLPCLCRVVENWEIVGVTRIERKRREGPPLVDAWTPRGSAHVASVPKLHD